MPMHGERVPVENSRLSGFFKLSVDERRKLVQKLSGISDEQVEALANNGELSDEAADRMIENVIGTMSLPVGIATNFVIDGKHYLIPFCLEESSVVAAASNMAKRCLQNGGCHPQNDAPLMIDTQIRSFDIQEAMKNLNQSKDEILFVHTPSTMIKLEEVVNASKQE